MSSGYELKDLEEITSNAKEIQDDILKEILTLNANTKYLQFLDGNSDKELFKKNVPVVSYDDVRPYIERVANGEQTDLISGGPITRFLGSSGTSGGKQKIFPVNDKYIEKLGYVFALRSLVMSKHRKTPATPCTGGCKTLFVGNLSFQVEKKDVEELFKGAGEVVDVRFAMSKEDGRFRGFGHVEFATAEQASKAMELNGQALLGRDIRLHVANEMGDRPASTAVFVKGFDRCLADKDIKSALSEHFASCGEILGMSVPCFDTGASVGIAIIVFKGGADKAYELNGSDLGGRNLIVGDARPKDNKPNFTPRGKKTTFGDE